MSKKKVTIELEVEATGEETGRELSSEEIKEFFERVLGEKEQLPGQLFYGGDDFSPSDGKVTRIEVV